MLSVQKRGQMHRSKSRVIILTISLFFIGQTYGQKTYTARVLYDSAGLHIFKPLKGVDVAIYPSKEKRVSDSLGQFTFSHTGEDKEHSTLVFSFGDFLRDTLDFSSTESRPEFLLSAEYFLAISKIDLGNIEIIGKKTASSINSKGLQKIEVLNEGEFKKAACCTLSESFETNNTVEVSNADGVSGIRQVEMLGLAGRYVLMTRDNIPGVRGMNVLAGLDQIPGPFVGGVHIAKGAGSVTNGYEGITGGLNYALKSEPDEPRLFVNGYVNSQGRAEGNLLASQRIGKKSFNHAYLHYHNRYGVMDHGRDGFTDMPVGGMVYLGDYFKYYGNKMETQIGFLYTLGQRSGGDIDEFAKGFKTTVLRFKFNIEEERAEAFAKLGIFLNEDGSSSIGNIFSASQTRTTAVLNNLIGRSYNGVQKNISYTGLYTTPDDNIWSMKSGVNLVLDNVTEQYIDSFGKTYDPNRNEFTTGVFSELVYNGNKLNWVLGARVDKSNLYGIFFTPRFHLKYDVTKLQQLHVQAGIGRRTPWIFADNLPYFISNRSTQMPSVSSNKFAYGLPQEQGFNSGISYTWHLMIFKLPSTLSTDVFYTHFINQTVVDRDLNPGSMTISNQAGNASSMAQVDWNFKPHRRLDVKLSYRYVNSQMKTGDKIQIQTMQAPHRGLVVVGYENRKKWYVDGLAQFNSSKRLPSTAILSETNRRLTKSPAYAIANLQLRKEYKIWEFYAGCENIFNYFQKDPVLNISDGGKQYFDAAFAWGPVMGRNFYFGFRMKIK